MTNEERAEALFRDIAGKFGLSIDLEEDEYVELSMLLPVQDGLQHQIWLCLQDQDEVWFVVDSFFTYSSFPFAEEEWVEQSFRTNLEGFLSGRFRIREGWFWTYLEAPGPDGWVTESRYTGGYHRRRRGHITVNIPRAGLVDG
jgi:hypothetical protein